jgi:hypothetical protein
VSHPELARGTIGPVSLGWILIVVLVIAIFGGGFGHARYGVYGWSPAAIVLGILLLLYLTGNLSGFHRWL